MAAPTLRQWIGVRIVDWYEHANAIGRGILYALGGPEYDPLELAPEYARLQKQLNAAVIDLPGTVQAQGPLSPALHLMLPCKTCKARTNAPCVNRFGETTGPHKARRRAAEQATAETG